MKYQLGQVQTTEGGIGFSILNEGGTPIVTFGYLDPTDAESARALIEKAIESADMISSAGKW